MLLSNIPTWLEEQVVCFTNEFFDQSIPHQPACGSSGKMISVFDCRSLNKKRTYIMKHDRIMKLK